MGDVVVGFNEIGSEVGLDVEVEGAGVVWIVGRLVGTEVREGRGVGNEVGRIIAVGLEVGTDEEGKTVGEGEGYEVGKDDVGREVGIDVGQLIFL